MLRSLIPLPGPVPVAVIAGAFLVSSVFIVLAFMRRSGGITILVRHEKSLKVQPLFESYLKLDLKTGRVLLHIWSARSLLFDDNNGTSSNEQSHRDLLVGHASYVWTAG